MTVQALARPLALALVLVMPAGATAQPAPAPDPPDDAPPHVMRLEGAGAQVLREGATSALEPGDPVLFGDRVDTAQAYVDILWTDGTRVALGQDARMEALAPDLLALTAGRAVVTRAASSQAALRVDTPAGSFRLDAAGEYRLTLDGERTTLGVMRGRAEVQTGMGDRIVEAGQQVVVRDGVAPEAPTRYHGTGYDSFVAWATAPVPAPAAGTPLETFQDPRFEAYSDVFNRYGAWETDAQYGAVWYPQVGADWRPYGDGYWQPYGPSSQWLWVGHDPWGWPTHHFGRWGVNPRGRWYWAPGRQWAPAWVSWSVGPGYIGWSALGAQDRPVYGWDSLSRQTGAYGGGTLDPARGWTIVPSDRFGQRGRSSAYAVDPRTLANLSAFVTQRVGPPVRYGVPVGPGYGPGVSPYGGPGGTTMYGPGGYYGGVSPRGGDTSGSLRGPIGPTRVGPPTPGYGGPTPPADDPYERAQRAVAPRSRQRAPSPSQQDGREGQVRKDDASEKGQEREPDAKGEQGDKAQPAPAPQGRPTPDSAGSRDRNPTAPSSSTGRASGATTGRRAVPRP